MSRFLSSLDMRLVCEFDGTYELLAPLIYESEIAGRIEVPAGFITDLASVPRVPFAYMVVGGKGQRAAVAHDWLYSSRIVDRQTADRVFAEALRASGYGSLVVSLMYSGVRIGGGSRWEEPNVPQPSHVADLMREPALA